MRWTLLHVSVVETRNVPTTCSWKEGIQSVQIDRQTCPLHSERQINGQFRIAQNDNHHGLYRSPYIVTTLKYISLRWAGNIDRTGQEMCADFFMEKRLENRWKTKKEMAR